MFMVNVIWNVTSWSDDFSYRNCHGVKKLATFLFLMKIIP